MNEAAALPIIERKELRPIFRPPERRPIYDFAAKHIRFGAESPFPGSYQIGNTPFVKAPLDALRRDDIETVSLSGFAQSAKSTAASLFCADAVANNPGALTWNSPTKDAAKKTAQKKIWPIFRRCAPIRDKLPAKSGILTINFPDAPFCVQTASEGNSHGDTVRYQVNDDIHIWEPGRLGAFEKRTAAFADGRGRKIFNLMTGCIKTAEERLPDGSLVERGNDAFEILQKGTRSRWHVLCPNSACRHRQPLVWQHRGEDGRPLKDFFGNPFYGIIWDTNDATRPGGRWAWDAVKKTARWRCRKCAHEVTDTRPNRHALNAPENGADFVAANLHPEPGHWSGIYPAMASELVSWGQLVVEFLFAMECAAVGNVTPLREFVMNRLADVWFEGETCDADTTATADYKLGDKWLNPNTGEPMVKLDKGGQPYRYLLVDQQKEGGRHFKCLVREFADGGASRLLGYWPRLETAEEVETIRKELGIKSARVGLDVGDGNDVTENYEVIARYGWTGLKGSGADGFDHIEGNDGKKVVKPFSRRWYGDPAIGKAKTKGEKAKTHAAAQHRAGVRPAGLALCFHWSNSLVKDRLSSLRAGRAGYWGRPSDECEEYKDGLHSEAKVEEFNTRTGRSCLRWKAFKKNNHAFDLECMALVMAMMSGILAQPEQPSTITEGRTTA
ncbi:MAG: phage terminase large subunit family protein [Rhodospirillales bacterium]|nr:phage terminase large subunit family protein [Acetobacter sp.]